MRWFPLTYRTAWSLRRKLFGYMLLLAAGLLVIIVCGLWLLGRFGTVEKDTRRQLTQQMDVFEREVFRHFDDLAAASIRLSGDVSGLTLSHGG